MKRMKMTLDTNLDLWKKDLLKMRGLVSIKSFLMLRNLQPYE